MDVASSESDNTRKYVYRRKGITHGPVTSEELRELAVKGELRWTDEVRKAGHSWKRACDVEGLFPAPPPPSF
jgi:hypothetical protein